jgi:hypothetical protein
LGLTFIFVRAPHPWGWEGIDHYHDLALELAAGRPFPTLEVPWGYAYFLAAFYRTFGDRPWIPLVVQAVLNASMPWLVFRVGREWFGERVAVTAAVLTALFSFNTVYASTQSSDAVCTVLFMTMLVAFVEGRRAKQLWWFGLTGLLGGLAAQFRPNLILIPALLAVVTLVNRIDVRTRLAQAALVIACAAVALAPWVFRNYRLTHRLLPTSVHGGVQLWYGTLQVGPYLNSRAYNPRAVFEAPTFDSNSELDMPLVVSATVNPCIPQSPVSTALEYWTDRDPTVHGIEAAGTIQHAEIPAPHEPRVFYYMVESTCPGDTTRRHVTPRFGHNAPFVFFVSRDHLGDLDVHQDLLDVFDVVRLVREAAWHEPPAGADRLRAAGIVDLTSAIEALTPTPAGSGRPDSRVTVEADALRATLTLSDGSRITVPRKWNGDITDLEIAGPRALALLHASASLAELSLAPSTEDGRRPEPRDVRDDVAIDRVFYRWEPHMMSRYFTLSWDNIRRDPSGFAAACAYRALRLFVIADSGDVHTTQQFERSTIVYAVATVATIAYLLLFGAGAVIAWHNRRPIALPLLLILYIPATLAPVLTNMRYTITVQPLIFMFVASAVMAFFPARASRQAAEEFGPAEIRTARRP